MISVTFKQLVPEDFDKGFKENLSALKPVVASKDEIRKIFQQRILQGWITYGLIKEGNIVATASMNIEQKFYNKDHKVARIEDVTVHPDRQRQGLGKQLMQYIRTIAETNGCNKIIIGCNFEDALFYEDNGYIPNKKRIQLELCW